jgi:hypothetical protein
MALIIVCRWGWGGGICDKGTMKDSNLLESLESFQLKTTKTITGATKGISTI